jgi:hypothetical protein
MRQRIECFFGGILVFATLDWKQLKPVSGLPAMLSPLMIMSFAFLHLGHSVRARGDPNLQRMKKNSQMDSPNYTPEIINEFKQLLCTSCTFVSDWDSPILEQSVIWVFGLHDAVKHAEATMLQRIKDSNVAVLSCSIQDKQMSVTAHSAGAVHLMLLGGSSTRNVRNPGCCLFTRMICMK